MNKKNIIFVSLFVLVLFVITYIVGSTSNKSSQKKSVTVETIKTGTSFGMCTGYCRKEFVINTKNILYIKSSWDNSKTETKKGISISSEKWNELVSALDIEKFSILPEVIGCPDCVDGGTEWIEIFDGKTTKRVAFEYGASLSGMDSFIEKLREIRNDVSSQFDKQ